MDIEYKRDLKHNYMVIRASECLGDGGYCIKMLSHKPIEGILGIETRVIDNQTYYYYDITSKQSISNVISKTTLSYNEVKSLLYNIINTIEESYDYLLFEDDFVLNPDLIYMDINSDKTYLCYYSGYGKNIKNQMADLIEFIMNKVDYKDKDAVYLVYSMHSASKQDTFAFAHLKETLLNMNNDIKKFNQTIKIDDNKSQEILDEKQIIPSDELPIDYEVNKNNNLKLSANLPKISLWENFKTNIPVMMEKVVSDEEVLYYPIKTYVYTGLLILIGLIILIFCIKAGLIHNSLGNKIDYTKLLLLLILLASLECYMLKLIWKNDNKITKIIPKNEYIDPQEDEKDINDNIMEDKVSIDEDYNPTCLLNDSNITYTSYILRSVDNSIYEDILINEFPFFIGKLKKNVDYYLDNEAVSRYHAKITMEDGSFYLYDLNSKNGTYLNGIRLAIYERKQLEVGDLVAFANVKYYFDMM